MFLVGHFSTAKCYNYCCTKCSHTLYFQINRFSNIIHMWTYKCIQMYTCAYKCIHVHTNVYMCIQMYTSAYKCTHVYTNVSIFKYIHLQMCPCKNVSIYKYIHVHLHLYIFFILCILFISEVDFWTSQSCSNDSYIDFLVSIL